MALATVERRLPLEPLEEPPPEEEIVKPLRDALAAQEARLEGLEAALKLYEERVARLEGFAAAAELVGAWKAATCAYQRGGVCTLWRVTPEAAKRLHGVVEEAEGEAPRIRVDRAPWFCALCPLYRRAPRDVSP